MLWDFIGERGYLCCPDGSYIRTDSYDGYGNFGFEDAYELVVDFNLVHIVLNYKALKRGNENLLAEKSEYIVKLIGKFVEYELSEYKMSTDPEVPDDWKREIGIAIAGEDESNISLPFPLKIVSRMDTGIRYKDLPPSLQDPLQGCA